MALIIYPTTGYNSYVSLVDAEDVILNNIIDHTQWDLLTDPTKELYLKQSTKLISMKITDPETDPAPDDLILATCYLSTYSVGKDMTNNDGKDNIKIIDIEGAIMKEYFGKGRASNSFPSYVNELLAPYGLVGSSSFKIARS